MRYWVRCAVAVVAALPLLGASCRPSGMPSHSPDGRTVGFVASGPQGSGAVVWLYDKQQRAFSAHACPDGWRPDRVQWIGEQLWVECSRPGAVIGDPAAGEPIGHDERHPAAEPLREQERLIAPFDTKANAFFPAKPGWRGSSLLGAGAFGDDDVSFASHQGRPALFVQSAEPQTAEPTYQCRYDLYAPDDGKKIQTVTLSPIMPAGGGWTIRLLCGPAHDKAPGRPEAMPDRDRPAPIEDPELTGVEVYDAREHRVCTISAEEIAPACYRGIRSPDFAAVSQDQTALVLAFGTETIFRQHPRKYTFGVFDIASGKRLWTGDSDSMTGVPLVSRDEIWTLEFVGRHVDVGERTVADAGAQVKDPAADRFTLVHHVPAKDQATSGREELFTYDLGGGRIVRDFAPGPDGLLVVADGREPQLLLLPLKPGTQSRDVVAMPVVQTPAAQPERTQK